MKKIGAAKFKEQCLAILEQLDSDGLLVTKRGKPIAKIYPFNTDSAQLIGRLKGKLKIKDEVLSTGVKWNAQS
ncbi:MAG: hypothetical protein HYU97_09420 [Deltaproteobacteria bacterium]|nr:hypothetical protein [Deltaproteobacteria bacterium]